MNFITRTLLSLLFLTSIAGNSVSAMQQKTIMCKDMTPTDFIVDFKELPREIRCFIIFLSLQDSMGWDLQLYKTFTLDCMPSSLAFSSDEKSCIMGFRNKILLWNIETTELLKTFTQQNDSPNYGFITYLAWSPDKETILIGTDKGQVNLWNIDKEEPFLVFQAHTDCIISATFSLDGKTIFTGAYNGTSCVWDSKTGNLIKKCTQCKSDFPLDFNFQRKTFACQSTDQTQVYIGNSTTKELIATLTGFDDTISTLKFSFDGEICLGGNYEGTAYLWNVNTKELVKTFKAHTDIISSVAYSPQGDLCLTGSYDNTACVWKRIYGFNFLTDEQRESVFKRFLTLYPLIQKVADTTAGDTPAVVSEKH